MKKNSLFVYLLLITMALSFSSCGSQATEDTIGVTSTTVESTSTPESTATPTPTPTATPDPTSTPTPTPTSDSSDKSVDEIAAEESYTLSEQEKADLRALGATEEQINNVKSGQDFVDLVYKLVDSGSSTGKSSSGSNNNSNSSNEEEHDPSRDFKLGSGDTVQGSMGSSESESDPWGDIPATPLGSGDTVQGSM